MSTIKGLLDSSINPLKKKSLKELEELSSAAALSAGKKQREEIRELYKNIVKEGEEGVEKSVIDQELLVLTAITRVLMHKVDALEQVLSERFDIDIHQLRQLQIIGLAKETMGDEK